MAKDLFSALFAPLASSTKTPSVPTVAVSDLPISTGPSFAAPVQYGWHDGDKFAGGFGATQILSTDYWTLRQRSAQLFKTNIYARGIIKRLITNEINTGLHLEAIPEEGVLGVPEDSLSEWTEEVENRFQLWANSPRICDKEQRNTFGGIQAQARLEALIEGDVLVVLGEDRRTRRTTVRLIAGGAVQTPLGVTPQRGHRIVHGVELDDQNRHVAYWIRRQDGTAKRLPAFGEKSGRRLSWLVYGTNKRIDEVRGEPLLAAVLQSLREIDRYRDSTQRKAMLGSTLLGWIEKEQDKPGSRALGRSALGRNTITQVDNSGTERSFTAVNQVPGVFAQELQYGERVKFNNSLATDEKFSDFEASIVYGVAWSLEVPPEILTLSFNANYSASQAAINEFKMYLDKVRYEFGFAFCAPIYQEWLLNEVLSERIEAPGLLDAWRDPAQSDAMAAWVASDWAGHIKPSTDIFKQGRGYELALGLGLTNFDRAAREFSGTKFSKNAKKLKREIAMLKEAGLSPSFIEKLMTPGGDQAPSGTGSDDRTEASILRLADLVDDLDERLAN